MTPTNQVIEEGGSISRQRRLFTESLALTSPNQVQVLIRIQVRGADKPPITAPDIQRESADVSPTRGDFNVLSAFQKNPSK